LFGKKNDLLRSYAITQVVASAQSSNSAAANINKLKKVLIIFIRNPVLGKVKTRLARTMGVEEALRIYRLLLDKTRAAVMGTTCERWLFYSDGVPTAETEWPRHLFVEHNQREGDLGLRMEDAFDRAFRGGAERVVIVGSDCPELSSHILEQAFAALDNVDFVVGPASDGGYYLLGMKVFEPAVFSGMVWSTEEVLAQTLERVRAMGKSYLLLPTLADIDEASDWEAYQQRT
jgi:rSAM/selenodomain-associated transferase 1